MSDKKNTGIVTIHGREYETVALRVKKFREAHPNYRLLTAIVHRDEACVVMCAMISDANGNVIATGHAEEFRSSSQINETSALENCETSAIGRALAALGMGGTEFASADEVARAVSGAKGKPQSVAGRVWDEMSEEEQKFLQGIADTARSYIDTKGGPEGMAYLEAQNLDADERVAVWSRFTSKERAAMEPHKRKRAA